MLVACTHFAKPSAASSDCAVEWDARDGNKYTAQSTVCWRINGHGYNYHCWDERTCKAALSDPSKADSGWSQNGECAQSVCAARPADPHCFPAGSPCACTSSDDCCGESVCRGSVCSHRLVSDNMIRYDNMRLDVVPFFEAFHIHVKNRTSIHLTEEYERLFVEKYAAALGMESPSTTAYPIAVSFEYDLDRIDMIVRLYENDFDFASNAELPQQGISCIQTPGLFYPFMTNAHRMNSQLQRLYVYEKNVPHTVFVYPNKFPLGLGWIIANSTFESVEVSTSICLKLEGCGGFSVGIKLFLSVEYHRATLGEIRSALRDNLKWSTVAFDRSKSLCPPLAATSN